MLISCNSDHMICFQACLVYSEALCHVNEGLVLQGSTVTNQEVNP
jgi:hypothetical protein